MTTHLINEKTKSTEKQKQSQKTTDGIVLRRNESIDELVIHVELFNFIYNDLKHHLTSQPNEIVSNLELNYLRQWQELVTVMVQTLSDRQAATEFINMGGPKPYKHWPLLIALTSEYYQEKGKPPSAEKLRRMIELKAAKEQQPAPNVSARHISYFLKFWKETFPQEILRKN